MKEDMKTIVREAIHTVSMECGSFTVDELAAFDKIASKTMTTSEYRAAILTQIRQESLKIRRK